MRTNSQDQLTRRLTDDRAGSLRDDLHEALRHFRRRLGKRLKRKFRQLRNAANTFRLYALWRNQRMRNDAFLRSVIEGQRVLIIGSGPSASQVANIPDDVKILTCKGAIRRVPEICPARSVDIYFTYGERLAKADNSLRQLIAHTGVRVFITDDRDYVRRHRVLSGAFRTIILDYNPNNYYLNQLIAPHRVEELTTRIRYTSSGIRLLQYALYFGAREVYIAGIDLFENGYFWGSEGYTWHQEIDRRFLEIVASRHKNIFTAARVSPLEEFVPFRELKG